MQWAETMLILQLLTMTLEHEKTTNINNFRLKIFNRLIQILFD